MVVDEIGFLKLLFKLESNSKNNLLFNLIIGFSILWSLSVYLFFNTNKLIFYKWLTVISLIAVALCSLIMLTESLKYDWYVILSAIMFCVVTVLTVGLELLFSKS